MEIRTISSAGYNLWESIGVDVLPVPVCGVDVDGDVWGRLRMEGHEIKPSMSAETPTRICTEEGE